MRRRPAAAAATLTALATALMLSGCGTGDGPADDKPVVLTTFTVLADIAANVGGEHVTVESITKRARKSMDTSPPRAISRRQPRPT